MDSELSVNSLFTINLIVPFDSNVSKSLVLIQHLTAVSICKAITEFIPDFPIRIKWPNDLYYKREFKLGGILVSSSQSDSGYNCSIGVGLNIANSKPTICINDLISEEIGKLETEDVIAKILNKFETQLELLKSKGFAYLVRDYEKFWLHTNEQVSISLASGIQEKVTIKGLDENGYLLVLKESGEYESVMDNGRHKALSFILKFVKFTLKFVSILNYSSLFLYFKFLSCLSFQV
ncbi:unnamed protein product [Meloidogyne enterolobii]|uniref:Uncharacterized protein n=1 Tax=Meloidogyne enterolobii TaxID=390850 RepID=A0ACB0Y5R6_MELEN